MKPTRIAGQPSWRLRASKVDAWLSQLGGHLGPVTFRLGRKSVQPYLVPPWANEQIPAATPPVLRVLRGDFFCLPFGRTPLRRRAPTRLHGETCNAPWTRAEHTRDGDRSFLRARLALHPGGNVVKELSVRDGQTVVYSRHVISGLTGPLTFAHHPCLVFPPRAGTALISTSGFSFGQALPGGGAGDRTSLKPGVFFRSLARVPREDGGHADLGRYPARPGCEDVVQLATQPSRGFAWTAVAVPVAGYVWFTLKDPRVLPSTVLWFSNGGVDAPPLRGRLTGVLGVEEACTYFGTGVKTSAARNGFSSRGCPTCAELARGQSLDVRTITGVAAIPRAFGRVARILPGAGHITLVSHRGRRVRCAADQAFLRAAGATGSSS